MNWSTFYKGFLFVLRIIFFVIVVGVLFSYFAVGWYANYLYIKNNS